MHTQTRRIYVACHTYANMYMRQTRKYYDILTSHKKEFKKNVYEHEMKKYSDIAQKKMNVKDIHEHEMNINNVHTIRIQMTLNIRHEKCKDNMGRDEQVITLHILCQKFKGNINQNAGTPQQTKTMGSTGYHRIRYQRNHGKHWKPRDTTMTK